VYGKSLSELASAWKQSLRSRHTVDQPEPDSATFLKDIARVQQDYHALFDRMSRGIPAAARLSLPLDEARTAADRADPAVVVQALPEFESARHAAWPLHVAPGVHATGGSSRAGA
jgi:hypothetical protein